MKTEKQQNKNSSISFMVLSKMNKKAISISILLLVISSLILSILSLAYFMTKNNDIKRTISFSNGIDEVYLKEDLLNFYLQDIFDKAVRDLEAILDSVDSGQAFINSFKKELNDYKDKNGNYPMKELQQAENQISEENVELTDNKLVLKLHLEIKKSYISGEEGGTFTYNYEKQFEKVFK
ncbi:MAG: hypothetical protein AABX77_02830 [Nanoarchaeota archaeon]